MEPVSHQQPMNTARFTFTKQGPAGFSALIGKYVKAP